MAERIGISGDSAKRINRAVRFVERRPRGGEPGERFNVNGQIIPAFPGIALTNIGSGSLTVPGSGTVTLWGWAQDASAPAAGDAVTAYNFYGAAIASGKMVWLVWFAGRYCVITAAC